MKTKVHGNYTYNDPLGGFTDAAVWQGQSTPSHYEAIDMNKIKDRVRSTKIAAFKGDKDAQYKHVKDNSPSPFSYKEAHANYTKTQTVNI